MGDQVRRLELRVAKLEKSLSSIIDQVVEQVNARVAGLVAQTRAVAEAAGSALAVEALTEIVGEAQVGEKMRSLLKRKQVEAEEQMAAQVKALVESGRAVAAEKVGKDSLVVGQRKEGEVQYRVDLIAQQVGEKEWERYLGMKVGDVLEEEKRTTEIREIYDVVPEKEEASEPSPSQTPAEA